MVTGTRTRMRKDIIYASLRFFSGLRQGINASSHFCTERVKVSSRNFALRFQIVICINNASLRFFMKRVKVFLRIYTLHLRLSLRSLTFQGINNTPYHFLVRFVKLFLCYVLFFFFSSLPCLLLSHWII